MRRPLLWASVLVLLLVLAACGSTDTAELGDPAFSPSALASFDGYVVVLDAVPGAARAELNRADAASVARAYGLIPTRTYGAALVGFAARMPAERAAALARDPRVASVEIDLPMSIAAQEVPTGIARTFAIGNESLAIDGRDDLRVDAGVAVVDTGIDLEHPDLNVMPGVDCTVYRGKGGAPWSRTYYCSTDEGTRGDDDHYHGTHVAGTIGALDNGIGVVGVAPGVRLYPVKVLDASGSGYTSGIIAGIDWAVAQSDVDVINMSLGGAGISSAYETAIDHAVAQGVVVVVAAGNSAADANDYSPAYVPSAITVSALADFDGLPNGDGSPTCRSDEDDTFANFSNYGTAVDVIAPGVCILSTYPIEQGSYGTISGTSMAAPHVAGAAAILASRGTMSPSEIADALTGQGNYDWDHADDKDATQEPLLDLSNAAVFAPLTTTVTDPGGGGGGGTPNQDPQAAFTFSCDAMTCTFDASASSDPEGADLAYAWDFGDGSAASAAVAPSHIYGDAGTYAVTLQVTDDAGASSSVRHDVVVPYSAPAGDIVLSLVAYKVKGVQSADLTWTGATGTDVDIYRDTGLVTTTVNDGDHTDATGQKGGGTADYRVCEAGTTTCSDVVTAVW